MKAGRRALLAGGLAALAAPALAQGPQGCRGQVFLTIDTGWSREADSIAAILRRHAVTATLFIADEPTYRGDTTLSESWAPFWRARVAEGHSFASHTWRHWYFANDPGPGRTTFRSRRGQGQEVLDQAGLCAELARPIAALRRFAPEARVLPLWRAPGGIVTRNAVAMAAACGLRHQGWTRNGFLGDELDSSAHPNAALLRRNLANIGHGEVLVMHWGVRSRREPFAGILEALVTGLLARGLCFAPLPPEGVA
ncbi:polysaccharide deacetylase family protein [Falsiroseomonas tokyonensis]|uniref:Chitooligosaccharide deacetylase n=1 Tax=Falsiroseomonas tokyonensis TaxID=430521 RepID=A0ABV7BT10_9PROT|nr:polysaccharide deacetylase family protein [Falsiroseomonas tokyonensis]MBU8537788.1 polysaccharide deacetylase family protein [Falsiroseomonas tokyonensis]